MKVTKKINLFCLYKQGLVDYGKYSEHFVMKKQKS